MMNGQIYFQEQKNLPTVLLQPSHRDLMVSWIRFIQGTQRSEGSSSTAEGFVSALKTSSTHPSFSEGCSFTSTNCRKSLCWLRNSSLADGEEGWAGDGDPEQLRMKMSPSLGFGLREGLSLTLHCSSSCRLFCWQNSGWKGKRERADW